MSTVQPPLDGLTFSLAGPGRVGSSLARWLVQSGARLLAVAGTPGSPRAGRLASELGGRVAGITDIGRDGAELLLLAVADPVLPEIAAGLAEQAGFRVALHTSGAQSATALAPLAATGVETGSFHPLKAFTSTAHELQEAARLVVGIDGTPQALALARRMAEALGATVAEIPPETRRLYHLGATLAAGGVTTLVAAAASLAHQLDLPNEVAAGYLQLARGALATADPEHLSHAITGPVARGDRAAVEAALADLAERAPELEGLVLALALSTLDLLRAAHLDTGQHRELYEALLARRPSP